MSDDTLTLGDLGERRIVHELLAARYASLGDRFGHDCAPLPAVPVGAAVVATTDPCPPPMAHALGYNDEFYRGWLLAAINLSDLAAAGATPAGLLTSLILPSTMPLSDFKRLLDGIDACCAEVDTTMVGGNLKEGPAIDASATAVGYVEQGKPLSRHGARVGDAVIAIGELGAFWGGALTVRAGRRLDECDPLLRNVLAPVPKVQVATDLHRRGLLRCAIDNSDGLQPSLAQLARENGLRFLLDLERWQFAAEVRTAATALSVDPIRMALGWGDWQLIGCCAPENLGELREIARTRDAEVHLLGEATDGSGVIGRAHGWEAPLMRLESERFTTNSWFSAGLDGYVDQMLHAPLLED
jgi:thiamine-monophosphate kinase